MNDNTQRTVPTKALLLALVQHMVGEYVSAGHNFTAYAVTLSLRALHPNMEIRTHSDEIPSVGPMVYDIMTDDDEWTYRMLPADDGRMATTWILKETDPQFDWADEDTEEIPVNPWNAENVGIYGEYDDYEDEDETLEDLGVETEIRFNFLTGEPEEGYDELVKDEEEEVDLDSAMESISNTLRKFINRQR